MARKAAKKQLKAKSKKASNGHAKTKKAQQQLSFGPGKELTDSERQELFIRDKAAFQVAKAKLDTATADLRNVRKRIKADGFSITQILTGIACSTPEGEADVKAQIAERLQAALWVGASWGDQLELFNEPDRTPLVDRAFGEGKRCSMENKRAKPDYAPGTPGYVAFMNGYHEHQRELAGGLKAKAAQESTATH